MSKPAKIALLLATLWPVAYMFLFFCFIITMMVLMPQQQAATGSGLPVWFAAFFVVHFLTIFLVLGLTVIYIINVFRNNRVAQDKKALWAVVIFLGNIVAMPVYWYLYIWPEPAN